MGVVSISISVTYWVNNVLKIVFKIPIAQITQTKKQSCEQF